jgi:hypothetical protein
VESNRSWLSREHVIEALRELSDEALQRRLWQSAAGELSSFEECRCQLFNDSGLGMALDRGPVFADDIDADLRLLRREVRHVDARLSVAALLNDTVLGHVRGSALALLRRISDQP